MPGPKWTPEEEDMLRRDYLRVASAELACRLGRSVAALWMHARIIGLGDRRPLHANTQARDRLRGMVEDGYSDQEIADAMNLTRENVRYHRRRLGLPANRDAPRQRERSRQNGQRVHAAFPSTWKQQSQEAAAQFATESGWPVGLRLREVQILNLLAAAGVPLTGRQIADGIGIRNPYCSRVRPCLRSHVRDKSYLGRLAEKGLISRLAGLGPKTTPVNGRGGKRCDLYILGPHALAILLARSQEAV